MQKINEKFEELTQEEQKKLKTEAIGKKEITLELLLQEAEVESELSKHLTDFLSYKTEGVINLNFSKSNPL